MRSVSLLLVAVGIVTIAARAEAIPAFARRYRTSCRTCHAWTFPTLNAFGVRFRQNGYQFPDGAEEAARTRVMIEPGTIDERTAIFDTLPLSIRSRVLAEWAKPEGGERRASVGNPTVRLVGGGSLYEDVSSLFALDLAPTPVLHFATVGFHNLFGEGGPSLTFGKLLLSGFGRPGHRAVTRLGSPIGSVVVGVSPFALEGEHYGLTLASRPDWGPVAVELSVVNGAPGLDGSIEPDDFKDFLARSTVTFWGDQVLGVFGYFGRLRLERDAGGIEREWDDRVLLAGGDLEANVDRFSLYAAGLYGRHTDPDGEANRAAYVGVRAELLWAPIDDLSFIARYDAVESADASDIRERLATLNVGMLVLTSLRASIEGTVDLRDLEDHSRVVAFVEGAL